MRAATLAIVILGIYVATYANDSCLPYEPAVVSLTGRIERQTFPGRPNYESVARGDEPETGFYLHLSEGICTLPANDELNVPQSSVTRVQLVLDSSGYNILRPFLGTTVTLKGTLFAEHTAHHHAPLLLKVAAPIQVPKK